MLFGDEMIRKRFIAMLHTEYLHHHYITTTMAILQFLRHRQYDTHTYTHQKKERLTTSSVFSTPSLITIKSKFTKASSELCMFILYNAAFQALCMYMCVGRCLYMSTVLIIIVSFTVLSINVSEWVPMRRSTCLFKMIAVKWHTHTTLILYPLSFSLLCSIFGVIISKVI